MFVNLNWKVWAWGALGVLFILSVLFATGVLPGFTKRVQKTTLEMWGYDSRDVWEGVIQAYRKENPAVNVNYTQLPAYAYEEELVDRLASGRGPDIFMIENTWLPKHGAKLTPAPQNLMSAARVEELFPATVAQDFTAQGSAYALPLYIDTLALLYNKDLFDRKGIVAPPVSWISFEELAKKLGKSAVTLGDPETLQLLMMQSGVRMIDNEGRADFRGAEPAVAFYLKFPHPADAFERFARGELAMMPGYHSYARALTAANPSLRVGVAEMPQSSRVFLNYPSYAGLGVWNQSARAADAWHFIAAVTTDPALAGLYSAAVNEPPALRALINSFQQNPGTAVFANQALTARSWPQADAHAIAGIFADMIDSLQRAGPAYRQAGFSIQNALRAAEARVDALRRPF